MSTEQTKADQPSDKKGGVGFGTKAVGFIGATVVIAWSLSFIVMPLIQGQQQGLDWFTAICRAAGIYSQPDNKEKQTGSVSLVTWSPSVLGTLAQADVKKGEALATDVCVACHNTNGMSADPATTPSISGQPARSIYKQLWDIKNGTRINEAMQPLVADLTDDQIAGVAVYYSQQKSRYQDFRLEPEVSPAILKLVTEGDAARALPACQSCHDAVTGGPIETPKLVGQYPGYTAIQLEAFAAGGRRNDVFARMRTIAAKLTPDERAALAKYYDGPR